MGRPVSGSLSSYSLKLRNQISQLRDAHPGWGAMNIWIELRESYGYSPEQLPSHSSIHRYLKEVGLIPLLDPLESLPSQGKGGNKLRRRHDLWELDAQGAAQFSGLGFQAMINIKDSKSKAHCMAFPIAVKNGNTQPSSLHYYWAFRLSFSQWGLPKVVQVDKDSVFYENRSRSPFPKHLHLWLIGLGVEMRFIKAAPPIKNAMIERSHQTMFRQVNRKEKYACWKDFFRYVQERRKLMNEKIPNRMLGNKAPLVAFPKAIHSGRNYQINQEQELIDLKKICRYLAKCTWYRKVASSKTISLGGQVYYLKNSIPKSQIQVSFSSRAQKLIFRDDKEQVIDKKPMKNLTLYHLMGASTKELLSIKYKLENRRDFPL